MGTTAAVGVPFSFCDRAQQNRMAISHRGVIGSGLRLSRCKVRISVWSRAITVALFALAGLSAWTQQPAHHWAIVVHGGAGVIERSKLGPKGDSEYRAGLKQAIEAGAKVLDEGGSSLDAVEAAIR